MSHARTQIRQAVLTLLKNNTSAGNNVFEERVYPLDDPKLPALLVYTKEEVIEEKSISYPRTQARQLSLTVEAYAKAHTNADAVADGLALEIEQLIATDPTLGGLVKDSMLSATETRLSGEGEQPVATVMLTYAVMYSVKENAPQTLI